MREESYIPLPGLDKQLRFFIEYIVPEGKKILVAGAASEIIAKRLSVYTGQVVEMIVEDYESLMNARIILDNFPKVVVKLMEFDHTDYKRSQFDYIFAQASVSSNKRRSILKEFKRILKDGGSICVGEMITLNKTYPKFIYEIFESNGLDVLAHDDLKKFYESSGLKVDAERNLSESLTNYYRSNLKILSESLLELNENERAYYKKLINRISHESKSFLAHGGDKYVGFETMIMRKI